MELAGKRIVLGVTGGIAAYKAAELLRLLLKEGAAVQVVMTEAATHFVTPVTFQALSGQPVFSDQWDPRVANNMAHIDLSREADLLLVAPASADFLAKLAHGLADDLLTTLVLARDCPLLVAPAMNRQMWENPATCRNIATLRGDGVDILGPGCGDQACGETGPGANARSGRDPARTGRALPAQAAGRQARVADCRSDLRSDRPGARHHQPVERQDGLRHCPRRARSGCAGDAGFRPGQPALPAGVTRTAVTSALQMHAAVHHEVAARTTCSSPSPRSPTTDRRQPSGRRSRKAPRPRHRRSNWCRIRTSSPKSPRCPRSAAVRRLCCRKRESARIRGEQAAQQEDPLIVGNLIHDGFGGDDNTLILFDDDGQHPLRTGAQIELARQLVARIASLLEKRR
jgi:phosphopantothenoylcysteine decarboxylase/phosphopantothenate--cysteine ligase